MSKQVSVEVFFNPSLNASRRRNNIDNGINLGYSQMAALNFWRIALLWLVHISVLIYTWYGQCICNTEA